MAKAATRKPKAKAEPKPKLTNEERHERFVDMAHKVGASDDPKDFDKAFERVTADRKAPVKKT